MKTKTPVKKIDTPPLSIDTREELYSCTISMISHVSDTHP